jgi:hypothetical protein
MNEEMQALTNRCGQAISRREPERDFEDLMADELFVWLNTQGSLEDAYRSCPNGSWMLVLLEAAGVNKQTEILGLALRMIEQAPVGGEGKKLIDFLVDGRSRAIVDFVRQQGGDFDLFSDEVFDLAQEGQNVLSTAQLGAIETWAARTALQLVEEYTWQFDVLHDVLDCILSANGLDFADAADAALAEIIRAGLPADAVVGRFHAT